MEETTDPDKPKQPKRKQRNPSEWKREKRKRSIIAGESHISVKGELVLPKKIGADCNCKLKCYQKVDENTRQRLFKGYYSLKTYDEQNAYLFGLIKKQDVKRKKNLESDRRTCTYKYHVRDQGKEIQVCKLAFAHIHAVSFRKIRTLSEKLDQNILFPRDGRGRHNNRPTKVSPTTIEMIKTHIFQVMKSNDLKNFLKEDKNKQMTPELNVAKLHTHYLQMYEPEAINIATGQPIPGYQQKVKNWLYRKVFHDEVRSRDFQVLKRRLEVFAEAPQGPKGSVADQAGLKLEADDKAVKKSRRKGTAKKLAFAEPVSMGYATAEVDAIGLESMSRYVDPSVTKAAETLSMFQQKSGMQQSCSAAVHFPMVPSYGAAQGAHGLQLHGQRGGALDGKQLPHHHHHHHAPVHAQAPHHVGMAHHQVQVCVASPFGAKDGSHAESIHQHSMQDFSNSHQHFLNAAAARAKDPPAGRVALLPHSSLNHQSLGGIGHHHHPVATAFGGMGEHHLASLQRHRGGALPPQQYPGLVHGDAGGGQQLDLSVGDMASAFYA